MATDADDVSPFTDYSCGFQASEECASAVVDRILTNGGEILWQKYLRRKALIFARQTIVENLQSELDKCFVANDRGEEDIFNNSGWGLEEEPSPMGIDCWAGYVVPTRKKASDRFENTIEREARKKKMLDKMRQKARNARKSIKQKNDDSRPKSFPIPEANDSDEESERLRQKKIEDKKKQEEKRRQDAALAIAKSKDNAKNEALLERMENEPHTYDHNGELIWIEPPNINKMPQTHFVPAYKLKMFGQTIKLDSTSNSISSGSKEKPNQASGKASGKGKGKEKAATRRRHPPPENEFKDGFAPLKGGQPPITETMEVQPGVTLISKGRTIAGPPDPGVIGGKKLTRQQYVQLAEFEINGGVGTPPVSPTAASPTGDVGGHSPASKTFPASQSLGAKSAASGGAEGGSKTAAAAPAGDDVNAANLLPPLPAGRGLNSTLGAGVGSQQAAQGARGSVAVASASDPTGGGNNREEVQKSPPAPHPAVRSKYTAIGNLGRPPRYHPPNLGGPYMANGIAQPPLGATMGHGLVHSKSSKEEAFFFPSSTSEQPPALLRAASDGMLRKGPALPSLTSSPTNVRTPGVAHTPKGKVASRTTSKGANSPVGGITPSRRSRSDSSPGAPDTEPPAPEDIFDGIIRIDRKSAAYNIVMHALAGDDNDRAH